MLVKSYIQVMPILKEISNEAKRKCYDDAMKIIDDFCAINNIKKPKISLLDNKKCDSKGYYQPTTKRIYVLPKNCSVPTKKPGFSWSYPGYKADVTPFGVLLHEFGHYMHYIYYRPEYSALAKNEKVSSYEPNEGERIAETFKLFLGNPDLLKKICPLRYKLMIKSGLKPVIKKSWQKVLENAHPDFHNAINNRISS